MSYCPLLQRMAASPSKSEGPTPRPLEDFHLPSPGLPQKQKDEIASVLATLDNQQNVLYRYADRNYLKAAFRRGFLGVMASAKRSASGRAGLAVLNTRSRRAYNTWRDSAARRRWRLTLLRGALISLQKRQFRKGWNSWTGFRESQKAAKAKLAAAGKKWVNKAQGAAYRKWAAILVHLAKLKAATSAIANRRTKMASNTWGEYAARRKWRLTRLRGALTSLMKRQVMGRG